MRVIPLLMILTVLLASVTETQSQTSIVLTYHLDTSEQESGSFGCFSANMNSDTNDTGNLEHHNGSCYIFLFNGSSLVQHNFIDDYHEFEDMLEDWREHPDAYAPVHFRWGFDNLSVLGHVGVYLIERLCEHDSK